MSYGVYSSSSRFLVVRPRFTLDLEGSAVFTPDQSTVPFAVVAPSTTALVDFVELTNLGGPYETLTAGSPTYTLGAATGWLSASIMTSTGATRVRLTVDPTGIEAGSYAATVAISGLGVVSAPSLTVELTVTAAAPTLEISISDTSPDFTAAADGLSAETSNTISNLSDGTPLPGLTLGATSYLQGAGWFTKSLGADGTTVTQQCNATGLSAGTYQCTYTAICATASNTPQTVTVTLVVTASPVLRLVEPVFTYNFGPIPETGTTVNHVFNDVINGGGGSIDPDATISAGDPWLGCDITETTPGVEYALDIHVDPTGMAPGTHQGTVTLSSTGAANVVLTVNMTIVAVTPTLSLSTQSMAFPPVEEGASPSALTLTITGNVTLAGPTVSAVNYGAGPTGWLTVTAPAHQGSGVYTSTVTPAVSTFAAGLYAASFTVSDANTSNDPLTVTVSITITEPGANVIDVPRAMDGTPMDPPTWGAWSTTTGLIEYTLNGGSFAEPTLPSASSLGSWVGTPNVHLVTSFAELVTAVAAQASQNWPIIRITQTIQQSSTATVSFPVRTGAGWCLIQTSAYASLPQALGKGNQPGWGTRVDEATHLAGAPIWERANQSSGGIAFANRANNYAFQGVKWINTSPTPGNFTVFLRWGTANQTSQTPAIEPTDLLMAHCVIDGRDEVSGLAGAANGLMLDGNRACIRDGIIRGLRLNGGGEEHTILCTVGTGNYLIRNMELEARSICILFGGNQGGAIQRNADCLIEYNHHYRRPSWIAGSDSSRKNLGTEIKSGQRIWTQACELENGRPGDQYHEFVYGPKVSGDSDAVTCKVKHVGARFIRMRNCTGVWNTFSDKSQIGGVERYALSPDAAQYHYIGHVLQMTAFTPTSVHKGPRFGVGTSTAPIAPRVDETTLIDAVMENCTFFGTSATYEFGLQTLATDEGVASCADTTPRMVMRNCIDLAQPNLTQPTTLCTFSTGYSSVSHPWTLGLKALFDHTCGLDNYILNRVYTRHTSGGNRWGSANDFIGAGGVRMQNFTYVNVSDWAFADLANGDGTITNAALKGTGTDGKDVGPDMPRLLSALASAGGNAVRRITPTG